MVVAMLFMWLLGCCWCGCWCSYCGVVVFFVVVVLVVMIFCCLLCFQVPLLFLVVSWFRFCNDITQNDRE